MDIESLFPMVKTQIRNCPNPVLLEALVRKAREFCRDTRFLRETQIMDVVADEASYDLDADTADTEVIGLLAAQYDGTPIDPAQFESYEQESGGQADWYTFEPPNQLWLNDIPNSAVADGLALRLILQPTLTALTFPDSLVRKFDEALADGAIAYLAAMPKSGWYSPEIVAMHEQRFSQWIGQARIDASRGNRTRGYRSRVRP